MQDAFDPPAPSTLKPILYGAAVGVAAMAIFLSAYLIAPNLGLAGNIAIALGVAFLVMAAVNAFQMRASGEIAALARGEDVPAMTSADPVIMKTPAQIKIEEGEARVALLRQQTDAIDRATQREEWLESARALADELKRLATDEMAIPGFKHRQASLARFRQAANIYQRITSARGVVRSRNWGVAQIALGECLVVLGEAELARDEVMEATIALTKGLEVADLSDDERGAGENALAQAEGVLASMADESRRSLDDGFI